jgi:hypothetical protein
MKQSTEANMSSTLLDSLFEPPKHEIGDLVVRKRPDLGHGNSGVIISVTGWFALVRWTGIAKASREYLSDLEPASA